MIGLLWVVSKNGNSQATDTCRFSNGDSVDAFCLLNA